MSTPDVPSTTPTRNRRWYQFSLRTLLVVMLLASLGMSWFAVKLQQARRQREAVEAIKAAGGEVGYCYARPEMAFDDQWLVELLGIDFFGDVVYVRLNTPDNDALREIAALPRLEKVILYGGVTDGQLVHLAGLKRLTWLDLSMGQVTDNGLAHLANLTQLRDLSLPTTQITDAGLPYLAGLTRLQFLDLSETRLTDEGVAKLQQALPNCSIHWYPP